jgi:hypothetical protein|tara:strand:+ start:480 stop:674 length:195 start_codon:yes stop_codon:yes gene_type:complete
VAVALALAVWVAFVFSSGMNEEEMEEEGNEPNEDNEANEDNGIVVVEGAVWAALAALVLGTSKY